MTASPISFTSLTGPPATSAASSDSCVRQVADLGRIEALAELGEADEVREGNRDLEPALGLCRDLRRGESVVADLLAHVELKRVLQHRTQERADPFRDRGEALADLVLRVAFLGEHTHPKAPVRCRELRHGHADDARDLEHLVLRDADVGQLS